MSSFIYKILRPAEWHEAQATNEYAGAAVDLADGYIHFSTNTQVEETVRRHFNDTDTIHLLAVDTEKLPDTALVWEPSRRGDLFPHLYAPLPMTSVARHWTFERQCGIFDFAEILKGMTK